MVKKERRKSSKRSKRAKRPKRRNSSKVRKLYRSGKNKIIGGVCGGVAEYLDVDPVIVRLLWVIGAFAWGAGIPLYIIAWIIMPRNPDHRW